ncbi:MAG: hypothetical protein RLN60_01710 [Phycisphaerales bacterium]
MNLVQKVRTLVDSIIAAKDPLQVQKDWEMVERLLCRFSLDADEVHAVCKARDAEALDSLVHRVEHPEPAAPRAPGREVTAEEKHSAMRAFRKRLKLARLADESKLGGRQLSGGRKSQIDAIIPPSQFGWDVWRALASDGQLDDMGGGFYRLAEEPLVRPPEP